MVGPVDPCLAWQFPSPVNCFPRASEIGDAATARMCSPARIRPFPLFYSMRLEEH